MAMALGRKNKHGLWQEIMLRHWSDEARKEEFAEAKMRTILDESLEKLEPQGSRQ